MGQLAQTTACSHYHQVRARLARRLLMNRDQVRGNQFHVTQEFLAHMLGVRRVGVTNAANSLREEGLIARHEQPARRTRSHLVIVRTSRRLG